MIDFKKLDDKNKNIINMYTTARQFKNAINDNEKIVLKTDRVINKVYPYIVNKSFACEIYLKLIIKNNDESYNKIHTLKDLYIKSNIKKDFEKYIMDNVLKNNINYDLEKLNNDLQSISNAFVEWRYIFENKDLCISVGFFNLFCDYLDRYCLNLIRENSNIDMDIYTCI